LFSFHFRFVFQNYFVKNSNFNWPGLGPDGRLGAENYFLMWSSKTGRPTTVDDRPTNNEGSCLASRVFQNERKQKIEKYKNNLHLGLLNPALGLLAQGFNNPAPPRRRSAPDIRKI
jgi:hypothetical protein